MVGLTGFVVAFGVLIVQMATQTLSPRFMRLWYRDGLQKAVLGTFVGTLTFSLALLRGVERDSVPDIGVTIAGLMVTVSVVLFLVYLDRFVHSLAPSPSPGSSPIPARASSRDAGAPAPAHVDGPALAGRRAVAGGAQRIGRGDPGDRPRGLLATAIRHDCLLVLPHAVGDIVPHGSELLQVYGSRRPARRKPARMLALGEERTIEQDPAFALRILVDIAIRALSPPSTTPRRPARCSARSRTCCC